MTHVYKIEGMTCQNCVAKVKSELLKTGHVLSADIQLAYPQATIEMKQHVSTADLQAAVYRAGSYTISEAADRYPNPTSAEKVETTSYYPIFLIFGYIILVTLLVQYLEGDFRWMEWMTHFMAGFFLVFSFFKLLNLKGFAEGYSTYDIIAKRFPVYGFVYPFIELLLAIALLLHFQPVFTNLAVLLVMAVSCIGVVQSLLKKAPFQCACLGTIIKLPLSRLTLLEDVSMMLMAGIMLFV